MMRSRVTDILGIKHPIVEGGMSIAGNGLLAAAGQAVALVREVKSAAELIADMVAEADAVLTALQSLKLHQNK